MRQWEDEGGGRQMKGFLWAAVMITADDVGPGPSMPWSQDGYALRDGLDGRT
jgi:hypothetical protein